MKRSAEPEAILVITADDYGYWPSYNQGILEAAEAGAVDSVSAMVGREWCDPEPLLATGVEVGLHFELPGEVGEGERAGARDRETVRAALVAQLERFERLFGRPPEYLDGHNHCHARRGLASVVGRVAGERGLAVRSVDARHRGLLSRLRVPTPDRLVGRLRPSEPALPELLAKGAEGLPPGITEWMTHPGHPDPESGSTYDAAREEDLSLLLRLRSELRRVRGTHRDAFASQD